MLCAAPLNRPAERGTLDRLGRGLPLRELDLGDGLEMPLAVRHVLRW